MVDERLFGRPEYAPGRHELAGICAKAKSRRGSAERRTIPSALWMTRDEADIVDAADRFAHEWEVQQFNADNADTADEYIQHFVGETAARIACDIAVAQF